MPTNITDPKRKPLPVEYTPREHGQSSAVIMTGHGTHKNQLLFVFDGPEGGELVVPFDDVYYNDRTIVLTRTNGNRETKVFSAEHWGQYGAVSEWFTEHGHEGIPRRYR